MSSALRPERAGPFSRGLGIEPEPRWQGGLGLGLGLGSGSGGGSALFSLGGYGGGSGGVPGSVGLSSRADAWLSAQESKEHSPRAAEGALGKANRSKKASPPLGQAVGAVKPSMTSAMAKLAPARLGRGWGAA